MNPPWLLIPQIFAKTHCSSAWWFCPCLPKTLQSWLSAWRSSLEWSICLGFYLSFGKIGLIILKIVVPIVPPRSGLPFFFLVIFTLMQSPFTVLLRYVILVFLWSFFSSHSLWSFLVLLDLFHSDQFYLVKVLLLIVKSISYCSPALTFLLFFTLVVILPLLGIVVPLSLIHISILSISLTLSAWPLLFCSFSFFPYYSILSDSFHTIAQCSFSLFLYHWVK